MSGAVAALSVAKKGITIQFPGGPYLVNDLAFDPNDGYVEFRLESDNDIVKVEQATNTDLGDWMAPRGGAASSGYEVRATLNSGTSPGGSGVGTWLVLSSNRFWSLSRTTPGVLTCNLTIEIRDAVTLSVLATTTVTLTATVEV